MSKQFERSAGVLLHISSLPNEYGIGSMGKEAYAFVDFLSKAKVKYWQILPLVQTGYGDSPYQSVCCNSGNPYFIDLEQLQQEGLLTQEEVDGAKEDGQRVDYAGLYERRIPLLRTAYSRFNVKKTDFIEFINSGEFEDYALFMALKSRYRGSFDTFPDAYKYKEHLAMYEFRKSVYKTEYCFWLFVQYMFRKQWKKLKQYANEKGIQLIGDLPLYVAYDSSDVWAKPELFLLDEELKPTKVAGVPPDYFSETGQLWGNPLYNWDMMKSDNFRWWIHRIEKAKELYDVIRIDHFRGLDRYYTIPYGSETAMVGEWVDGPKMELFQAIEEVFGDLSIIAEDLGILDDGVIALREETGYPGMKILMFAFDGTDTNDYLPKNIEENSVCYTGTHDNDTAFGYANSMTELEWLGYKQQLREALKSEDIYYPFVTREDSAFALCVCALASKSALAILPMQDILQLGTETHMNTPGTSEGNWQYRMQEMPSNYICALLRKYIKRTNRA